MQTVSQVGPQNGAKAQYFRNINMPSCFAWFRGHSVGKQMRWNF